MSEPLRPIPTPPAQWWRQIRLQYIPVVVFVLGVAAATFIWMHWVAPPTMVGEAEAIRADIRSVHVGVLRGEKVTLLQTVKAGQTLGHVFTTEPAVAEASVAVLRAELDAMKFTMNPVMGQQRAALDYERLLLDMMKARVDLAALQAQLFQAQSTFDRTHTLFTNKLVTEERFEEVRNSRDSLQAQVKAQTELIARIEPGLKQLISGGPGGEAPSAVEGLRAALKVQEEKLRLTEAQLQPVALVAPIDGVITAIHRQPGETVTVGEPIFQITANRAERIVGFIRQPLTNVPAAGTTVEIRTRTFRRQVGTAMIAQVGNQFEPIGPTLLAAMRLPVTSVATEFGLRVLVTAPAGLNLRPGEQVDVIIRE